MVSKSAFIMGITLSLLVALTSWLALRSDTDNQISPEIAALPIGIATEIQIRQMTDDGKLYYQLYAEQASQYGNNWYNLLNPQGFIINDQKQAPWRFSAKRGKVYQDTHTIDLWDNVVFKRVAREQSPALEFNTSMLRLNTLHKTAYTTYPVKFFEPSTGNVANATGMIAWLDSQTMKLFSKVDSYYEPIKNSP